MSDTETPTSTDGIAIIGMSGRFPGSKNISEFWQNLRDGIESISFFSPQEQQASGISHATMGDRSYVNANGVLEDIDLFDAAFFGFNPRDAEIMDPQQRLFLECAWEALENAGYDPATYAGSIGLYAGASMSTYLFNLYSNRDLVALLGGYQILLGNDKDHLTTRVAYKLNLRGPSVTVQTACSTSLVAVCLACSSLLNYQCDMALAGGVSISIPQKVGYFYREGGIASPDGHCRTFDARAQGTVGGNGLGIVVLKRLADAQADRDTILAIIRGSAINNDGSLKVGYTAPSVDGQAEVIAMAQAMAEVDPETISYIEAHGTGTPLGDPIEIAALTQAFRASTAKKGFCAIGSVKTNIGHLDAAAGVAGLIKAVLALRHKCLPPSLHFKQPNPEIDFENSPFKVNSVLTEWEAGSTPRRAGVSSFGIGGTNAHVVLEEAPLDEPFGQSRSAQLLMLSARTSTALEIMTANLTEYLQQNSDLSLTDVAFTLYSSRRAFDHRRTFVCYDLEDAVGSLQTLDPTRTSSATLQAGERPVVFMFPGQGAQHLNMASELYRSNATFREQIDRCSKFLKPHLGLDLRQVLYPSEEQATESAQQLDQTSITQPALFVVEYALAKLWMECGVHPQMMVGHSIGEYVAACLAGVFSLEDALSLVALRGKMMQRLPGGSMLSVPLSEDEARSILDEELSLAAVNGPSLCVISGPTAAIDSLQRHLTESGVASRPLHTSHAFHSVMMEPILRAFAEQVRKVRLKPPTIPYVSNVTGTWITSTEATNPDYWAKHARQTVRMAEDMHELLSQSNRILLEVGPGQTLTTLARHLLNKRADQMILSSLRHMYDRQSDMACFLKAVGQLWLAGAQVDQSKLYEGNARRIPLPTYPFERQSFWIEPQMQQKPADTRSTLLYKRPNIADWFYLPVWKQAALPTLLDTQQPAEQKACWIMLTDSQGIGLRMVKRLAQAGHDVVTVTEGTEFTNLGDRSYLINPRQRNDYRSLLKELSSLGMTPRMIVHLWNITQSHRLQSGTEFVKGHLDIGFYSLLFLAQELGQQNITDPLRIAVISNDLQDVTGEETLCPEKAVLLGPCKVIPQEYPNISCSSIDIAIPERGTRQEERLIDQLMEELAAQESRPIVAYRGNHRWVQVFEPVQLSPNSGKPTRLRNGGVYLITGGLGGIGLVLAEYLAENAQAKLALIGRSAFPAREHWGQWLADHDAQDEVSNKILKFQRLEERGAEILVVSADVTNKEQMHQAIDFTQKCLGEIRGVIHTAGIAGGGIIHLKAPEVAASVLAPKVIGTHVLFEVLKEARPDFLVLSSSLSSIVGGVGQVDYCAANAFLDAFAHRNLSRNGTLTVSIDWPTWQEVGMAVNTPIPPDLKEAREGALKAGILSKEGVEAFCRILNQTMPRVIVSPQDIQVWAAQNNASPVSLPMEQRQREQVSKPTHPRPSLETTYSAPRTETEHAIADIWQRLLGIKEVGIDDNFFLLGGHSLLATQLISRMRDAFQLDLSLNQIFESPTVAELATAVEKARVGGAKPQVPTIAPASREQYRVKLSSRGALEAPQALKGGTLQKDDIKPIP